MDNSVEYSATCRKCHDLLTVIGVRRGRAMVFRSPDYAARIDVARKKTYLIHRPGKCDGHLTLLVAQQQ